MPTRPISGRPRRASRPAVLPAAALPAPAARRLAALLAGAVVMLAGALPAAAQDETLTLMTHESFYLPDAVIEAFEAEHGVKLDVLFSGDAGSMVNQAILTADRPLADVLYGIDNTFLSRALDAGIFEAYRSPALEAVPNELVLDPEHRVTPIDTADVCLNIDREAFEERGLPVPDTLDDLLDPALADQLVVENPATSSPGLAFLLATIATFGEDPETGWQAFWKGLRENGVQVTAGWEEAYYGAFSGGSGEGERPIVVSYASSPAAEVVFGPDPEADRVAHGLPRGRLLPAGRVRGHPARHRPARAGGGPHRPPAGARDAGRAAPGHVRLPGTHGRLAARGLRALRAPAGGTPEPRPAGHRGRPRGVDPAVDGHHAAVTRTRALLLAAPPLAFVGLFFVWPVANILALGVAPDGSPQLGAILEAWQQPYVLDVVLFTIGLATISTLLTLLLGLPVAWVFARFAFPGRGLARALTVVPFVLPTVVVGSAFLALLGPRSPVDAVASLLFGPEVPQVRLDGTAAAIVIANVFYNVAVVVRLVGGLWEHLDPGTEEAARVLGASQVRAFREVTWPLLRPAVVSAASVVFLFTVTSFGVVLLLGGPGDTTLEVEIYRQTAILLDLPTAAALTILQMAGVMALLLASARAQERLAVRQRLARAGSALRPPRPGRERLLVGVILAATALFMLTPLVVLVERALATPGGYGLGAFDALLREDPACACPRRPSRRSWTRSCSRPRRPCWPAAWASWRRSWWAIGAAGCRAPSMP